MWLSTIVLSRRPIHRVLPAMSCALRDRPSSNVGGLPRKVAAPDLRPGFKTQGSIDEVH